MVDETNDIAVVKEEKNYAHYLDQKRKVQTFFIAMKEAVDGCAGTIMAVLRKLCGDHQLNMDKLAAFGSDGAAVMMGNWNGVVAQLKQDVPWIIANHCVVHRRALATAQAADEITEHLYGLHTGLHPEKNTYECEELCTRREEEGCSLPGPLQRLLQTLHRRIQKDSQSQVSRT